MSVAHYFECGDQSAVSLSFSDNTGQLTRHFVVRMTSGSDTHATILAAGFLPVKQSGHPAEPLALADRYVFLRRPRTPRLWDVLVEYRTFGESGPSNGLDPNPFSRGAEIDWSYVPYQKPFYWARKYNEPQKAKNGRPFGGGFATKETPVMNSAGVLYNPPPVADDSRLMATIQKNMASTPAFILNYQDAINSDAVKIDGIPFPKFTLKSAVRVSRWIQEGKYRYRQVTLLIQYREEGWDFEIQDKGYEELSRSLAPAVAGFVPVAALKKITDRNGAFIKEPYLLDGKGKVLQPGKDPVYFVYRKYKELPFSRLPLA
jgi:hypothetical protein